MPQDPGSIPNRQTLRLRGYDYSAPGAYFITIVLQGRRMLFGDVLNHEMRMHPSGIMVQELWASLPARFPSLSVDDHVVMPNHFHGIIVLGAAVGATLEVARAGSHKRAGLNPAPTSRDAAGTRLPMLGKIVGAFKSLTTRRYMECARSLAWPAVGRRLWQRNYYEHIIRDEREWDRIRRYMQSNPLNWDEDEDNPALSRRPTP